MSSPSSVAHALVMAEPGLEQPAEMKFLQALNAVGAGFGMGQMGGTVAQALLQKGLPALNALGEAGSFFPENPQIPAGMRKADLLTPSEEGFANWETAYKKHMDNYDFENALKDKWGMLRNVGGN